MKLRPFSGRLLTWASADHLSNRRFFGLQDGRRGIYFDGLSGGAGLERNVRLHHLGDVHVNVLLGRLRKALGGEVIS